MLWFMGLQRVGHDLVTEREQVLERGAKAEDVGEGLFGQGLMEFYWVTDSSVL